MLIMTTKTQTSLRLDTDKLIEAKAILERLGLNFSEAVNIFTSMIVATKGLPFDVCLPNDETIAAMRDVRARKNLTPVALTDLQRELQHS
jgi:DNA-damage-inducible protein J